MVNDRWREQALQLKVHVELLLQAGDMLETGVTTHREDLIDAGRMLWAEARRIARGEQPKEEPR